MGERGEAFGGVLRRLRVAASLSQEELAERAGLSRNGVSALERGVRRTPRLATVRLLADALGQGEHGRAELLAAARPVPAAGGLGPTPAIPVAPTALVGRSDELEAIRPLLLRSPGRIVTLTGPGGVGKTRLALAAASAAAADFADGVVVVPLAAVSDPALVLPAIATALGVREAMGRPLVAALAVALRDRHLLLVLDNVEHVAAAAPDLSALRASCPGLRILATGRSALRLAGEGCFPVPPLGLPAEDDPVTAETLDRYPAPTLFVQRARAARPDFVVDDAGAVTVAKICRRLDGLPLAIELAAAWVRAVPVDELLRRLEPRLPLLRGGTLDQPERLRTMRAAIAWSHDLLSPEATRLFRRLSVFAGGFSLGAAERVWTAPPGGRQSGALDPLVELVDSSLVQTIPDGDPEPRYAMLGTVREFAGERLAESGEAAAVAAAHADAVCALVERLGPVLLGPDERRRQARCAAELGNIRAALAWALAQDAEIALRIGGALWPYWGWHQVAEGRRWLAAALARPIDPTPARARALVTLGALAVLEGDIAAGFESGTAAVAALAGSADRPAQALAHWIVACCHLVAGHVEAAMPSLDRALVLFEYATTSTDRGWAAYARSHRGAAAFVQGRAEDGVAFYEGAAARAQAAGSDGVLLFVLGDFAGWLADLGEVATARGLVGTALALAADHPGIWLAAGPLTSLALVDALEGHGEQAAAELGAVAAIRDRAGLDVPPHFQGRIARTTALAAAALGQASYEAAWRRGQAAPGDVLAKARARVPANREAVEGRQRPGGGYA